MLHIPTILLVFNIISTCNSYSTMSGTCDSSNLGAGPSQMGATKRPTSHFLIGISGGTFIPGTTNTIWLNRTSNSTEGFRGVLLYVTDQQGNRVGTLTGNANTHGKACDKNVHPTSTLTHNSNERSNNAFSARQSFTWNAPSTVNGPVTISAIAYETGVKLFNVPASIVVSQNPNVTAPPTASTTTGPSTTTTSGTNVVTVSGPLVDHYCWTTLKGIALDTKEDLKKDPFKHTVHCLIEVPKCKNSGFAIVEKKSGASQYTIKYDLDTKGNSLATTEMEKLPAGSSGPRWKETGFVVTATGTVDSSKSPPVLQVTTLTGTSDTGCVRLGWGIALMMVTAWMTVLI